MKATILLLGACLALLASCSDDEDSHDDGKDGSGAGAHEEHGPHGGELIELGEHVAHLEVVHDDDAGTITLYALDSDLQPTALAKAPVLNLMTSSGSKQVVATARGSAEAEWIFRDPELKGEPEGARLRVVLNGVTYTPDLPHHHDDHDDH